MNYILSMDVVDAEKLIKKALKETEKQNLYLMYLTDRPYLKDDKGFNSYMDNALSKSKPVELDQRSKDELIKDILERS